MNKKKIIKHIKRPRRTYRIIKALLKGTYYILLYKIINRDVVIKFPFLAYAKVRIKGLGVVYIDRKCSVHLNVFKGLTIVTLSKKTKVSIGKNCSLGGVTIRCANSIKIGNCVMTATCLLQDIDLVNMGIVNKNHSKNLSNPDNIVIKDNVWVAAQTNILGGSFIGRDSVISTGTTCYNTKIKDNVLVMGNPNKRGLPIDKILQLEK